MFFLGYLRIIVVLRVIRKDFFLKIEVFFTVGFIFLKYEDFIFDEMIIYNLYFVDNLALNSFLLNKVIVRWYIRNLIKVSYLFSLFYKDLFNELFVRYFVKNLFVFIYFIFVIFK